MLTVPNIIIVADPGDHTAARMIRETIAKDYNLSAALWTSKHYYDNEARLTGKQPIISVGGPNYNPVSRDLEPIMDEIVVDNDNCFIRRGFRKYMICGKYEADTTIAATKYFINDFLERYTKDLIGD